jgi:hypothetical protein
MLLGKLKTVFEGQFDAIEEADSAVEKFMSALPSIEKKNHNACYIIRDNKIHVKIKSRPFRYGLSSIPRYCPKCGQRICFWGFMRKYQCLPRVDQERMWLNPKAEVLCGRCSINETSKMCPCCGKQREPGH